MLEIKDVYIENKIKEISNNLVELNNLTFAKNALSRLIKNVKDTDEQKLHFDAIETLTNKIYNYTEELQKEYSHLGCLIINYYISNYIDVPEDDDDLSEQETLNI